MPPSLIQGPFFLQGPARSLNASPVIHLSNPGNWGPTLTLVSPTASHLFLSPETVHLDFWMLHKPLHFSPLPLSPLGRQQLLQRYRNIPKVFPSPGFSSEGSPHYVQTVFSSSQGIIYLNPWGPLVPKHLTRTWKTYLLPPVSQQSTSDFIFSNAPISSCVRSWHLLFPLAYSTFSPHIGASSLPWPLASFHVSLAVRSNHAALASPILCLLFFLQRLSHRLGWNIGIQLGFDQHLPFPVNCKLPMESMCPALLITWPAVLCIKLLTK